MNSVDYVYILIHIYYMQMHTLICSKIIFKWEELLEGVRGVTGLEKKRVREKGV